MHNIELFKKGDGSVWYRYNGKDAEGTATITVTATKGTDTATATCVITVGT